MIKVGFGGGRESLRCIRAPCSINVSTVLDCRATAWEYLVHPGRWMWRRIMLMNRWNYRFIVAIKVEFSDGGLRDHVLAIFLNYSLKPVVHTYSTLLYTDERFAC